MNELRKYFNNNDDRFIRKWDHYFDIYDNYLRNFQDKDVVILEIGVFRGGSLRMWKNYFKGKVEIIGVDINPSCKNFEEDGVKIEIGSQADINFLKTLVEKYPKIDIIIDDGSHLNRHQVLTFDYLFRHLSVGGIYICEDTHSSYWLRYGGGLRRRGTFQEYAKKLTDQINAWHSEQGNFKVDYFTKSIRSVNFYDSIVVILKSKISEPKEIFSGNEPPSIISRKISVLEKISRGLSFKINELLRFFRLPPFLIGKK